MMGVGGEEGEGEGVMEDLTDFEVCFFFQLLCVLVWVLWGGVLIGCRIRGLGMFIDGLEVVGWWGGVGVRIWCGLYIRVYPEKDSLNVQLLDVLDEVTNYKLLMAVCAEGC